VHRKCFGVVVLRAMHAQPAAAAPCLCKPAYFFAEPKRMIIAQMSC
jgi:hypothetical protein